MGSCSFDLPPIVKVLRLELSMCREEGILLVMLESSFVCSRFEAILEE